MTSYRMLGVEVVPGVNVTVRLQWPGDEEKEKLTLAAPIWTCAHEPSTSSGRKLGALLMRELADMTPNYQLTRRMDPAYAEAVDASRKINGFSEVLLAFARALHPVRFRHVLGILLRALALSYDLWSGCPPEELSPPGAGLSRATQLFGWEIVAKLVHARGAKRIRKDQEQNLALASAWLCKRMLSDSCASRA